MCACVHLFFHLIIMVPVYNPIIVFFFQIQDLSNYFTLFNLSNALIYLLQHVLFGICHSFGNVQLQT